MGTLDLDISGDFSLFDDPEAVTLFRIRNQAPDTGTPVANATKPPITRQLQALFGGIEFDGKEKAFSLPVAQAGSADVANGDKITDSAGVPWFVQIAKLQSLNTRWLCIARNGQQ